MKEWYSDIMNKYWPEIESQLQPDETVVHRFVGLWDGFGTRSSGLFVVTNKNLYMRGKPKVGAWTPVYKLASGKQLQILPLDSIYEIIQKKNVFIFRVTLDWMGGKYIGKKDKIKIQVYQGKEGKEKESKDAMMQRVEELKAYLQSKIAD
ncbi:MAG: hypothetical protein ACTSRS_01995 [Candidatus Helarchaeota archaeon]